MTTDPGVALVHLSDTDLMLANEADDVRGRTVVDRHGEQVGDIDDLIIDPQERRVRFLQVGGGGFLGIGEKKQLIPVDAIESVGNEIRISRERAEVARAPAYDPELVEEPSYYETLYGYYGYPPFWTTGYVPPRPHRG